MKYITASQAASKWGVSHRRVQKLCFEGRVEGTFKLGETWAIPYMADKPDDFRKRPAVNRNNAKQI